MNQSVRKKFNKYLFDYKNPSLRLIAEEVGISYKYLTNFKNGKVDLSTESLKKIIKFIKKYDKIGA